MIITLSIIIITLLIILISYILKRKFIDLNINKLKIPQLITKKIEDPIDNIILITGGNGQMGRSLIDILINHNQNNHDNKRFKIRILAPRINNSLHKDIEIIIGDVTNSEDVERATKGCKYVIHCAAIVELRDSNLNKNKMYNVNVVGTANITNACVKYGVHSLIYISSASVFISHKNKQKIVFDESLINDKEEPLIYYAQTKLQSEQIVLNAKNKGNLKVLIFRPPIIFGPYDNIVIQKYLQENNQPPPHIIDKNKLGIISVIHSDNLSKACLLGLNKLIENEEINGKIYVISDFSCKYDYFYDNIALLTKKQPNKKTFGIFIYPIIYLSIILNWLTGGRFNHQFFTMLNLTLIDTVTFNMKLSTNLVEKDLGFKPMTFQETIDLTAIQLKLNTIQV